jgi:hypothetical protein
MKFGQIEINPSKNPAVLDTATWDTANAWSIVTAVDKSCWKSVIDSLREGKLIPVNDSCNVYAGSYAEYQQSTYFLAQLSDGQILFIELGTGEKDRPLGKPIGTRNIESGLNLAVFPAHARTVESYVTLIKPDRCPKALGAVPRLGIGSRMTTAAWKGVWRAMNECNFRANPIQNSVREVNLLNDVLAARPPRYNYMANFGRVEEGHTGSTFEGLWLAGVLEALKAPSSPPFGADADHITVRRGLDDIARSKKVIDAAGCYTFFTLDVSDILDYNAMNVSSQTTALDFLDKYIPQSRLQNEVVACHGRRCSTGRQKPLDKAAVGRLVGKYWAALDAVEQLSKYIQTVKNDDPFDLELSIDETPSGVDAFTCLTTKSELVFLILELQRRAVPITHIAPNFAIEKGTDYRGKDGLIALEKRIRGLCELSGDFAIMLDCHSGDDLRPATRQTVGRAAKGNIHFKVSPFSQVIFAETMKDVEPESFRFWWDDTLDYARREAQAGSSFAAQCLRQYEESSSPQSSPDHTVFHHYNFGTVGKRDNKGRFVHRQKFYDLSGDFYREYQNRICSYLSEVAADIFSHA